MQKPSSFLKLILVSCTFGLNLFLISLPLQAQNNPVPDAKGGTEDTSPGGTRGTCLVDANSQPLTALIPTTEQRLELTTLSHPTVLINLPKQPGILAIKIPEYQPELQAGINYRWTVSLNCDSSNPPFVQGVIKRIQPNSELIQALKKTPTEQWLVYAKAGIWYDAIATLATLRQAQPNNPQLQSNWQKLLNEVKLNSIATAPLIQP